MIEVNLFFIYTYMRKVVQIMVRFWNPSPQGIRVGDCSVRAVSKALETDWQTAYIMLCVKGFEMSDMPNSNAVIDAVLKEHGFIRDSVPSNCKNCYTIEDFAEEFKNGTFVVGTGDHVVTIINGNIYDSWDSSKEYPLYFWRKKE